MPPIAFLHPPPHSRLMRRILSLLWPITLPTAFYVGVMRDRINLGGGERDIVLVVPLALFAALYVLTGLIFWAHVMPPGRSAWRSVWLAGAIILVVCIGLIGMAQIRIF